MSLSGGSEKGDILGRKFFIMTRGIKGSSEILMSLGLRLTVALLESVFV